MSGESILISQNDLLINIKINDKTQTRFCIRLVVINDKENLEE